MWGQPPPALLFVGRIEHSEIAPRAVRIERERDSTPHKYAATPAAGLNRRPATPALHSEWVSLLSKYYFNAFRSIRTHVSPVGV